MAVTEPTPSGDVPPGPLLRLIRDQRVAFLIVGGFNTVNGFALFVGFQLLFGAGFVHYMSALLCAHVIAVICAFALHRRFVFRVRGHLWLDLVRFEAVNLGALAVNAALLPLIVEVGGLPVIPAQLVASAVTVALSYLGHASFSFRRPTTLGTSDPGDPAPASPVPPGNQAPTGAR